MFGQIESQANLAKYPADQEGCATETTATRVD